MKQASNPSSQHVKNDILWSPTEPNRFLTIGTDIKLYEVSSIKDSIVTEYSDSDVIGTCNDNQYLRAFAWYPKSDHPLLIAIGTAQGRISLESLDPNTNRDVDLVNKDFAHRPNRCCSVLSWNKIESNLLLSGFEKYRGENCIFLWDANRSYIPSGVDATIYERRSMFNYDTSNTAKPLFDIIPHEGINSLEWFHNNSKVFICGVSNKQLRVYDTRDINKHQESTTTKATSNMAIDPHVEHRIATSAENFFVLWDVRNFEKPVVTVGRPKPIIKLSWSATRAGRLTLLCKDSSTINLYDIQSPVGNDEVEPVLVERTIQPYPSNSVAAFSWHPTQENRMLTMSQSNEVLDCMIPDRTTLNWSPTSEIVWTCGRKVLQCVDSRDEFYSCLDDISVKMRKRACQGYGLKMPKIWQNAELAEDVALNGVWMWLDLIIKAVNIELKKLAEDEVPKYEGICSVICGENGTCTLSQSEPRKVSWIGLNIPCKLIRYNSEERERALQLCGWGPDSSAFRKFLARLESDGHYARAATIAVFNLEIRLAIKILSKGALSKNYKGTTDLSVVAMALAGYTEEKSTLWQEVSCVLKSQLTDSYLHATFAFLTAEGDSYEEILKDRHIAVQDRMAFACLYLNDKKLADFLDSVKKRMTDSGNLDGILLTGLTNDGISLIQRYVDTTGDVQTASLIILHTLPSQIYEDKRAKSWVENYRNLLDTWRLWIHRAMFDVNWFNKNPDNLKPTQQIFVSCNFCRKSVSQYLQFRQAAGSAKVPVSNVNRKITCCPGCRKPLPRCSLCLSHMGTAAGFQWQWQRDSTEQKKITDFSNWLTWCQTCRHGGHSVHIVEWFRHNNECPVTGCMCKCMSLDANTKLVSAELNN